MLPYGRVMGGITHPSILPNGTMMDGRNHPSSHPTNWNNDGRDHPLFHLTKWKNDGRSQPSPHPTKWKGSSILPSWKDMMGWKEEWFPPSARKGMNDRRSIPYICMIILGWKEGWVLFFSVEWKGTIHRLKRKDLAINLEGRFIRYT